MKRIEIVSLALIDAVNGDLTTISGLLDYMVYDCHVPLERLMRIAKRQFKIPESCLIELLSYLSVYPDSGAYQIH